MRRQHFPPERNQIPAHLTLFHALPGEERPRIVADLAAACAGQKPFGIEATGLRSLGRGVAIAFAASELVTLRQALAREWRDWLTPQDSARIAPHVTIQNKTTPADARATLARLEAEWQPFSARAEGLFLWRYLGGPWELDRRFGFGR